KCVGQRIALILVHTYGFRIAALFRHRQNAITHLEPGDRFPATDHHAARPFAWHERRRRQELINAADDEIVDIVGRHRLDLDEHLALAWRWHLDLLRLGGG